MLLKRSTITVFSLLLVLFSLSACLTPPTEATPAPTEETDPLKAIRRCMDAGNQVFVDVNGNYCFSFPKGYYQDEQSTPEAVKLLFNINSSQEGIVPVTMTIKYETKTEDINTLTKFIKKYYSGKDEDLIPWFLGQEPASIGKNVQDTTAEYTLYAKHKDNFYMVSFFSPSLLSGQDPKPTELERLFFIVIKSFKFID